MNTTPDTGRQLPPETQRFVHDLRNCLASMRAGGNVLRRSANQTAIVEMVADNMFNQVQEMLDLLDDFIGRPPAPKQDVSDTTRQAGPTSDRT